MLIKKATYIFIFVFLALLIFSYTEITIGGSILWVGPKIFYLGISLISILLIYSIFSSTSETPLESYSAILLCLSISLITVIGVSSFPFDLDSLFSMQSILLMSKIGFSTSLVNSIGFMIRATYSLPALTTISYVLVLMTDILYIEIAKFLPLIITSIFFLIYYFFIYKAFNRRTALLSLILISSFPLIYYYSGIFSNAVLGNLLIIVSWQFLWWIKRDIRIVFLQIIVMFTFLLGHHLSYIIFILSMIILSFSKNFFIKRNLLIIFILLSIISMLSYYMYIYFEPLSTIISSITRNLEVEGQEITAPSVWSYQTIIQRITWAIYLILILIYSVIDSKMSLKSLIEKKYADFLIVGGFLFFFSLVGTLVNVPYHWLRVAIFGWLLFIPGSIAMTINSDMTKNKSLRRLIILSMCLLFIGNIFAIPNEIIDHRESNEYLGNFKNWIKEQEWNSGIWLNKHGAEFDIYSDETFRRLYLVNNLNITKDNYILASNLGFKFRYVENKNYANNIDPLYIIIRRENFYTIIDDFYNKKRNTKRKNIDSKEYKDIALKSNKIYDDAEVVIFLNRY